MSQRNGGGPVPWVALVYHDVVPETSAEGGGPERFFVPAAMFERMLDIIREQGHQGCSVARAIQARGQPRVAITFDDAPAGVFAHAIPALRARGMTATIYTVTDWVGRPGFMTWDQLRQAAAWGMSIQSHTRSHPFLSELDEPALRAELAESKATLDRELGQQTTEIAFPGGNAPRRALRHVMRDLGYQVAVGTRWGRNADVDAPRGIIRRCTVRGAITPEQARRFVQGDPWLALTRHPKELALRTIRATLGASRYSRWRRGLLNLLAGGRGA